MFDQRLNDGALSWILGFLRGYLGRFLSLFFLALLAFKFGAFFGQPCVFFVNLLLRLGLLLALCFQFLALFLFLDLEFISGLSFGRFSALPGCGLSFFVCGPQFLEFRTLCV